MFCFVGIQAWGCAMCFAFGARCKLGGSFQAIHFDSVCQCNIAFPACLVQHPKASESEDKVEFNPRTKTGKMAIAAARKLTELAHRWVPDYVHGKPCTHETMVP